MSDARATAPLDAAALHVLWHDIECGRYSEDLPLWRELAAKHCEATVDVGSERGGSAGILDVGAGSGRVALDLAAGGYPIVALDSDATLLAALDERSAGLPLHTVHADARGFALPERFALVLAPMQTLQLLEGPDGRDAFLATAHEHLAPDGLVAIALADALEAFDAEHDEPPLPDIREIDGTVYSSRPLAVVDEGDRCAIHRLREVVAPDGTRTEESDVVHLDKIDAAALTAEARAHGLEALEPRCIPATDEYVGSTVVLLHA